MNMRWISCLLLSLVPMLFSYGKDDYPLGPEVEPIRCECPDCHCYRQAWPQDDDPPVAFDRVCDECCAGNHDD